MTGFHLDHFDFPLIDVDNQFGGYLATRCLIEQGHRQIASITGPLISQSARDRLAGYQKALAEAEIPFDPSMVIEGDYAHRSGYQAMKQILQRKIPFSAVFSHNDRMAIAAISAMRAEGLRRPEDISVVGYDDIPEAEFAAPPLTTIRQPMVEVGATAVRVLLNLIEHPETPPQQVMLGVELIWRESVARKSTV
jgi:LacI family transcriptional regulator